MKKILASIFVFVFAHSYSQIEINNLPATKTPTEIVNNKLVGPGVTPFNIKFNNSSARAAIINDQCGYFWINNGGSCIGIAKGEQGALLTTGKNSIIVGPNNINAPDGASSPTVTPSQIVVGDPDLDIITNGAIKNVSILEFDFVAKGAVLNFDYVFASEEYPEYAGTSFNDVFGFFLSGPGIAGGKGFSNNAENIAKLPTTATGSYDVSINNVNDHTNSAYYVSNPPNSTCMQFDGFTTLLRATHTLECGQTYHIKLAVANVGDNGWDSGVFIKNFNVPSMELHDNYGLTSNPYGYCYGDVITLDSGITDLTNIFEWYNNNGTTLMTGPGTNGPDLTVNTADTYTLKFYTASGCLLGQDSIVIAFQLPLPVNDPKNITKCTTAPFNTFNINQTAYILGSQPAPDYEVSYYETSLTDAQNGIAIGRIPQASLSSYVVNGTKKTIWVRIEHLVGSGCASVRSFDILINAPLAGSFTYSSSAYCINNATPQLVMPISLAAGGTFTSVPPGLSIAADNGTISPNLSSPNAYTINYTIPSDGVCPAYSAPPVNVTIKTLPMVSVNNSSVCSGVNATVVATPSSAGTYSYQWTVPLGATNPGNVASFQTTIAGTYSVVIFDTVAGCSSNSALGVVSLNATPTISGNPDVCQGFKTQLTGSGTPAAFNTWTSSNPSIATINTNGLLTGLAAGTTIITYNNSNGCNTAAIATINPLPTASISGTTTVNSGETAIISINGTPNAFVAYTVNNNENQTVSLIIGGVNQTSVLLDGSGTAIITTPPLESTTTYTLVSVASTGTLPCSQTLTGSAVISVAAPSIIYYRDADNDGFGNANITQESNTGAPSGYVTDNTDCDDSNPNTHISIAYSLQPVATSICVSTGMVGFSSEATPSTSATVMYQWQVQTPTGTTWKNVIDNTIYSGAATATLGIKSATKAINGSKYRVIASILSGSCGSLTSDVAVLTVNPTSVAGSISGAGTICYNTGKTVTLSTAHKGDVQWQSGSTPEGTFTNIIETTGNNLNTGNLTATTYYQAVVTSGVCSSKTTHPIKVTVTPQSVAGVISSTTKGLCYGTNSTVLTLSDYVGKIKWQSSTDSAFPDPVLLTGTSATYTAKNLTTTTYYRAVVTSGAATCASEITMPRGLTVNSLVNAGTVSGTNLICTGTSATLSALDYDKGESIQWQKASTLTGTYANVITGTGSTTANYTTPVLTTPAYYRVKVTYNGCSQASQPSLMTIQKPVAGIIAGITTACLNTPSILTLTGYTGPNVQWYSSASATLSTFTPIFGATSNTYEADNLAVGKIYYRASVSYPDCNPAFTPVVNIMVSECSFAKVVNMTNSFSASAYPNPFSSAFMIDINTPSTEIINISVYDMLGKLIEQRTTKPSEIIKQKIGENYPSGIYNIIVTQGIETKTLRMIKQ